MKGEKEGGEKGREGIEERRDYRELKEKEGMENKMTIMRMREKEGKEGRKGKKRERVRYREYMEGGTCLARKKNKGNRKLEGRGKGEVRGEEGIAYAKWSRRESLRVEEEGKSRCKC